MSDQIENSEFIAGDEETFRRLYKSYKAMVFGISLRYTNCHDDAQDVLQETFIKVYKNRSNFDPNYPLAPWIKKIAINTALAYNKKNYRFILTDQEIQLDEIEETTTVSEDISARKQQLLQILKQLPAGYRTVFNLFAIENLTHKEIADYLNISESTSRTQYHKAKKMISSLLENKTI